MTALVKTVKQRVVDTLANVTFLFLCNLTITNGAEYSKPIRISADIEQSGQVQDPVVISATSRYVVYYAEQNADSNSKLYSVPIDGGLAIELASNLAQTTQHLFDVRITDDGKHVVFRAREQAGGTIGLYSAPISGGASIKLNEPLDPTLNNSIVGRFILTPDSESVIYLADQIFDNTTTFQLYSVPIIGGASTLLSEGNVSLSQSGYRISQDGTRLVYITRASKDRIMSAPVAGGESVELSGESIANARVYDFSISDDSTFVVYRSDPNFSRKQELFHVPITGGQISKLNNAMEDGRDVSQYAISQDSSHVVFESDQFTTSLDEIFSVDLRQTPFTAVRLLDSIVTDGGVTQFEISNDSSQVVYRADKEVDSQFELFLVSILGGENIKLSVDTEPTNDVEEFQIASNSRSVVYQDEMNLYSVPLSEGPAIQLNFELEEKFLLEDFEISPDGNRVIFVADKNNDGNPEIYSVPITGGSTSSLIGGDPIDGVFNEYFWISPNSQFVAYISNLFDLNKDELYMVKLIDDELCIPIKNQMGTVNVICL